MLAIRGWWFATHGPRFTSHFLLASDSDAARLLHFPYPVFRARAVVGFCRRQRRRRSAALLPAARGAPLRHVRAHHGHESRHRRRFHARLFRALDLPALSRARIFNVDAGARSHCCARRISRCTSARPCCSGGTVAGLLWSEPHPHWARTSRNNSQLSLSLNNLR